MEIKLIENPTEEFAKKVIDFQTKFFGWDEEDLEELSEVYYSKPEAYVIAYEGNQIIGCVNLLKRDITFDNTNISLGGIGGVCVHPYFRKRGIAKEMLNIGMDQLKLEKCDLAYLCTEISSTGKLYAQVGFVSLNRKRRSIGKSGKKYLGGGVMIAPVCSKDKFNLVLNSKSILDLQGPDW